jgi:hypothetical protein
MQLVMLSGAVRLGGLYFRKDLVNIYGMLRHISRSSPLSSPLACFVPQKNIERDNVNVTGATVQYEL